MTTEGGCRRSLILVLFFSFIFHFAFAKNIASDTTTTGIDTLALHVAWLKPDIRTDMVDYAKHFLGLAYVYGGTDTTGFDCSGFTQYVMHEFDVDLSRTSRSQMEDGKNISYQDAKPGDLIFFRRSSKGRISHVAMVVSNDDRGLFIIHSTRRGIVIDNLLESRYWRPKIYAARDVLHQFTDAYARERVLAFFEQVKQLNQLQVDIQLFAKAIATA